MGVAEQVHQERARAASKGGRRPIPGEHGAWGALLTGIALGVALAVSAGGSAWLALAAGAAAVDLFMLRESLYQAYRPRRARDPARQAAEQVEIARARRWAAVELLVLLGLGALLIAVTGQLWLAAVGAAGVVFLGVFVLLRRSRQERSFWAEVIGFVGMSAAGPVAYLLALAPHTPGGVLARGISLQQGPLGVALLVWLLLALYFVGPVYYVKMKVAQQRERPATLRERLGLGWGTLLYSGAVAGVLALSGSLAGLGPWPLVAYTPSLAKSVVGAFRVKLPLNLRRIGFTEVGLSLLFALGLFAALR